MQHYGAPTRLVDFTESPYVALYFALEAYNPLLQRDLAIYAIDYTSIRDTSLHYISQHDSSFKKQITDLAGHQDQIFDEVVDQFSHKVVWITEPLELNARIDRQAGTFLISGDKEKKIESLLSHEMYDSVSVVKHIIPCATYTNIYALLRKMNINAKTIYGDLGGLAKSIKMDMQVHT
jgi:hypothetical protein